MSIFGPASELSDETKLDRENDETKVQMLTSSQDETAFTSAQESLDSEDEVLERKRFPGTPSKWRRLTKSDREIVRGQDAIDDDNLSIHLYNAHALRARVRHSTATLSNLKSWQSKDRWRSRQEWVPSRLWTAWPLEESIVETLNPREGLLASSQRRPLGVLEQMIAVQILRASRGEFSSHIPADAQSSDNESSGSGFVPQAGEDPENGPNLDDMSEKFQTPLLMVDDEKAWKLMHPAVRRAVRSLDSLLKALHNARQNRHGHSSQIGAHTSESESGASRARRSLSRKRSLSQERRGSVRSGSSSQVRFKPEDQRFKKLRKTVTRDWSEVLGFALQSGWDADVVRKAAARCSELFSESMRFQDLGESRQQIPSSQVPKNETSPKGSDRICPLPECERCYDSRRALRRHVRGHHGLRIRWPYKNSDVVFMYKPGQRPQDATRHFIKRQTNVSHQTLSDGTHLDGFLQPIIAGKDWGGRVDKS